MRLTKNPTRTRLRRLCPERSRAPLAREGAAISAPPPFSAGILSPGPSRLLSSPCGPPGSGPVGLLQVRPGRLPDAAAGDQDEISRRAVRPPPVHLAQETFGPGPLDGPSNLPAGHHTEPRTRISGGARPLDGHEVRGNPARPGGHHRLELGGPRNPLVPGKRLVPTIVRRLRVAALRAILTHDDLSAAAGSCFARRRTHRQRAPNGRPAARPTAFGGPGDAGGR